MSRDLGAVARDIGAILQRAARQAPAGSTVVLRGQVSTMIAAYAQLFGGLLLAIVLIYLLIVVNFQSWLDPFVIVTALPTALAGIVWMLFLTFTTLSVPALLGATMCMGVATANSILVVSFAQGTACRGRRSASCRAGSGLHALSSRADDGPRDDPRHDADGALGRAERASGTGGDRRIVLRDHRDFVLRAGCVQTGSRPPRTGAKALRRLIEGKSQLMATAQNSEETPAPAPAPQRMKRRFFVAAAIAFVLAVAGILLRGRDAARLAEWTKQQAIPSVEVVQPKAGGGGTGARAARRH